MVEVFLRAVYLGTVSKLRYFSDQKSLDIVDYNPIGMFQFNLLHRISIGYPKYKKVSPLSIRKIITGVETILFRL